MANDSAFTSAERDRILTAMMTHRNISRSDAERIFDSTAERSSKRNPLLEFQWVKTFYGVCEAFCEGQANPAGLFVSVFWVRLYGVITELEDRFRKMAELSDDLAAAGKAEPIFVAGTGVYAACGAVRGVLSDDELVFTAFARHVHAHVYQSGFEYSIEPGRPASNLRTKQMVRTVGRHVGIDETHAIVDRICHMS